MGKKERKSLRVDRDTTLTIMNTQAQWVPVLGTRIGLSFARSGWRRVSGALPLTPELFAENE